MLKSQGIAVNTWSYFASKILFFLCCSCVDNIDINSMKLGNELRNEEKQNNDSSLSHDYRNKKKLNREQELNNTEESLVHKRNIYKKSNIPNLKKGSSNNNEADSGGENNHETSTYNKFFNYIGNSCSKISFCSDFFSRCADCCCPVDITEKEATEEEEEEEILLIDGAKNQPKSIWDKRNKYHLLTGVDSIREIYSSKEAKIVDNLSIVAPNNAPLIPPCSIRLETNIHVNLPDCTKTTIKEIQLGSTLLYIQENIDNLEKFQSFLNKQFCTDNNIFFDNKTEYWDSENNCNHPNKNEEINSKEEHEKNLKKYDESENFEESSDYKREKYSKMIKEEYYESDNDKSSNNKEFKESRSQSKIHKYDKSRHLRNENRESDDEHSDNKQKKRSDRKKIESSCDDDMSNQPRSKYKKRIEKSSDKNLDNTENNEENSPNIMDRLSNLKETFLSFFNKKENESNIKNSDKDITIDKNKINRHYKDETNNKKTKFSHIKIQEKQSYKADATFKNSKGQNHDIRNKYLEKSDTFEENKKKVKENLDFHSKSNPYQTKSNTKAKNLSIVIDQNSQNLTLDLLNQIIKNNTSEDNRWALVYKEPQPYHPDVSLGCTYKYTIASLYETIYFISRNLNNRKYINRWFAVSDFITTTTTMASKQSNIKVKYDPKKRQFEVATFYFSDTSKVTNDKLFKNKHNAYDEKEIIYMLINNYVDDNLEECCSYTNCKFPIFCCKQEYVRPSKYLCDICYIPSNCKCFGLLKNRSFKSPCGECGIIACWCCYMPSIANCNVLPIPFTPAMRN